MENLMIVNSMVERQIMSDALAITLANGIFDSLLPLTVSITLMLTLHRFLLSKLGVSFVYCLWVFVPLSVIIYHLPLHQFSLPWLNHTRLFNEEIVRYVVLPSNEIKQQLGVSWLLYLWLIVAIAIVGYWLVSHQLFKQQLTLKPLSKKAYKHLASAVNLPKSLAIYQSKQAYSPMLFGFIQQKLIIPEDFDQLYNNEQQQLILEHEICHFDRNDIYWNLIAYAMIALFWFHPLVWLAYFRYRRDQELSCDQVVLARKQLKSRINYSKALLVVAETAPPFAFAQLSFKKFGEKQIMFERIKHIQLNTKASTISASLAVILSVSVISGLSYAGSLGGITTQAEKQEYRTPPKVKEQAKPVYRVEPKYPLKAAEENIEGSIALKFDVKEDGSVENIEVMNAQPAYVFDRVAVAALKQWKYEARGSFHKNMMVQLDFRLDEHSTMKEVNLIERVRVTQ